ncbi:MAG: CDP-paratose 2-epimerase [Candidatus Iainarchaeum archaeon]|uniref:CDP-paratose 2-epimerase n=1 Tax=Candidatus Iainarchaeum sp. TaxID=3101447 RepID=A0A497JHV9_9ARCH|nr:MAG: CDP-paratose 2-epimerase [Candidatus Diapherotrites archaeon]
MRALVTGGAGFIGCNMADRLASKGYEVVVFDNFSRKGTELNAEWFKERHTNIEIVKGDLSKDFKKLDEIIKACDEVYHFGAQTSVPVSIANPRADFEANILGTLNVLEAVRKSSRECPLFYSSTNKVYGELSGVKIIEKQDRYDFADLKNGINEAMPLDFQTPYGCSKGSADQYVKEYAKLYGLKNIIFRQSCIYGPRQLGLEAQGWVAWFVIAALLEKPIKIYGDGKQVRDLLYIDDLVDAIELAMQKKCFGEIFNIGGGKERAASLLDVIDIIEKKTGKKIEMSFHDWRAGDQKVYYTDYSKAERLLGWKPKIGIEEGIERLIEWARENLCFLSKVYG